jgi:predicted nuclease of predicted toxin-antitoxin system
MDEDIQAKQLVNLLKQAGHDVVTVNELNFMGQQDSFILDYAKKENRVLLTRNCKDFEALHEENSNHAGILAIYQDSNSSKNLTFQTIVKAINNLESAQIPLNNQFIPLNHWNY